MTGFSNTSIIGNPSKETNPAIPLMREYTYSLAILTNTLMEINEHEKLPKVPKALL